MLNFQHFFSIKLDNTVLYKIKRVGAVVLPDVGARLPDVVSPAQQWGAGEEQCPGPAHHQQTLGDPPAVKLALP